MPSRQGVCSSQNCDGICWGAHMYCTDCNSTWVSSKKNDTYEKRQVRIGDTYYKSSSRERSHRNRNIYWDNDRRLSRRRSNERFDNNWNRRSRSQNKRYPSENRQSYEQENGWNWYTQSGTTTSRSSTWGTQGYRNSRNQRWGSNYNYEWRRSRSAGRHRYSEVDSRRSSTMTLGSEEEKKGKEVFQKAYNYARKKLIEKTLAPNNKINKWKTTLVKFLQTCHDDGSFSSWHNKLIDVDSYEKLICAFSEYPDITEGISYLHKKGHDVWLFKDSTWGWLPQWFYVAPFNIIRRKYPVLYNPRNNFKYHCWLCQKGSYKEDHITQDGHNMQMLRFLDMYGNNMLPDDKNREAPFVITACKKDDKKYFLDVDEKSTRGEVPITQKPQPENFIPNRFTSSYQVPQQDYGCVVFLVDLFQLQANKKFGNKYNGSAVKIISKDFKFGYFFQSKEKGLTYYDLFCYNEISSKESGQTSWRSFAVPIDKKGKIDVYINDHRYSTIIIERPTVGYVAEYRLNDKGKFTKEDKNWLNIQPPRREIPIEDYLKDTYADVKAGVATPIQVLGPDNFMIGAMVYYQEDVDPGMYESQYDDDTHYNNNRSSNYTSSTTSRSPKKNSTIWKPKLSINDLRASAMSVDKKKEIMFYLHGDQTRDQMPLPGLAPFAWPRPDSGPIKYALNGGRHVFRNKVLLHPTAPCTMYWFRHPNIHDEKQFVPQMMTTLSNMREIASTYWGADRNKVFVSGASMGGYGAVELAAYWGPEIVKGAVFACPSHDANRTRDYFVDRIREIPSWFVHSRVDNLCKWEETMSLIDQMLTKGVKNLRLTCNGCSELDGHSNAAYILEYPCLYEWLFNLE